MVYRQALKARMRFRKLKLGAAFVFASAPTETPMVKDSHNTYRDGNGESVIVSDVSVVCIAAPMLGQGPATSSPPSGSCKNIEGSGDPSGTPDFIGQIYKDTTTGNLWRANSLNSGDWTLEVQNNLKMTPSSYDITQALWLSSYNGAAGLTALEFPNAVTLSEGIEFNTMASIQSISFPKLTSNNAGSLIIFTGCSTLTSINLSALEVLNDELHVESCSSLTTLSLSALTSIVGAGGGIICSGSSSLQTVNLGSVVIDNNNQLSFDGCALSAASVNHILARGVASPAFTTGTVDTSGGTSAAPTGQGIADKATLIGRGVVVNTN